MTTLAPKLPWSHAYAGGFPRLGGQALPTDPDAIDYLQRVAVADGAGVQVGIAIAVDNFVKGCKADGIWDAIGASCLLCGPRTIAGALVPLKGVAPTAYNFVSANYNQETGLVGVPAAYTYLDTNRAGNADGQDDAHLAVYATSPPTTAEAIEIGAVNGSCTSQIGRVASETQSIFLVNRLNSGVPRIAVDISATTGFRGASRPDSSTINARANSQNFSLTQASLASGSNTHSVYKRGGGTYGYCDSRLAFYSVGASLSLSSLDSRITKYVADVAAAIP